MRVHCARINARPYIHEVARQGFNEVIDERYIKQHQAGFPFIL